MVFSCEKLMTHISLVLTAFLLFYIIYLPPTEVNATPAAEAVDKWAIQFGDELWELAQHMTKSQDIKAKYKEFNARVELKNGAELIKSITANVEKMFLRKVDAVQRIMRKAEKVYENFEYNETDVEQFTYYSSKFSKFDNQSSETIYESVAEHAPNYLNFTLNPDTHFFDIPVDTEHSSVHVPSNVYDKYTHVMKAIMWSKHLDDVFRQNYASDPALSWQYFGSDTGILRHFPGLMWPQQTANSNNADTYDCRKRSWYIETATCSKDIVILFDNSGSMKGFRNHVGKFAIRNIMNTFSNNDFFTIFNYSKSAGDVVECFKDTLVQATPENIEVFNKALEAMPHPKEYADLNKAYEKAFQLLKKYYIQRNCNETKKCNQAIMLVTDGVADNTTTIFEKYNWGTGENETDKMQVRIFTYLLGKEVTKVREIQWMACLNRGYYSHVATLDEVHEEVMKYVDVIATPLVLQDVEHPPTWTHSFQDITDIDETTAPRLLIAVGVPAFDRSYLKPNATKEPRRARLLGVAGTDVPVLDINKLTLPYKLGVNGYSFLVSNNGYVLLHPDLRVIARSRVVNPNYNSIDLTEVEHMFEDIKPREPGSSILEIRSGMVNHLVGEFKNISVKFHYDKMRRVSEEKQDYFFAPLMHTPFSLGIVLPSEYGKTWIKVGEEVLKNKHMKVNISEFFMGENWKVHPDWVYCKFHYLEGHEYSTPELELRDFLAKMVQQDWEWSEQYGEDENEGESEEGFNFNLESYYCNKELVQLLIFDAKVTNASYGEWKFADDNEYELIESFNGTLRFVATMSGLTRWQFIHGEPVEIDTDKEFGDYHKRAIDEPWYKSAILQHHEERIESFVYSVRHAGDDEEDTDLKVTASHAIFPRDGGQEAAACVVGFQFSHNKMYDRFRNITGQETCYGCIPTCEKDDIECYAIDNNAYILLSQYKAQTGGFFGEFHGDIMSALVYKGIYLKIDMYDYQNMCEMDEENGGSAYGLMHPIQLIRLGLEWLVAELFWYWAHIQWWVDGAPFLDYEEEVHEDYDSIPGSFAQHTKAKEDDEGDRVWIDPPPPPVYFPCDTITSLYVLQSNKLEGINDKITIPGSRSFWVKKIPNSNLLLVVINVLEAKNKEDTKLTTKPRRIEYNISFPCHKVKMSSYERRRIDECFTEDENEANFTYCGDATTLRLKTINLAVAILIYLTTRYLCV